MRLTARTTASPTRCMRRSITVCVPVDDRAARTRHPDAVPVDATVEVAAVLVLLEEGVERLEQHQARLIARSSYAESSILRHIFIGMLCTRTWPTVRSAPVHARSGPGSPWP